MSSEAPIAPVAPPPTSEPGDTRSWGWLLLLSLVAGLAFQGTRGLFETTEGRYARIAQEMVQSRDWSIPRLFGNAYWTKPPLAYWAIASGMELLGQNAWGVRFFNWLAYLAAVLVVAELGATMWDRRTGTVAGTIYATSFFPVLQSHVVTSDTLLTLFELSMVLAYWKARRAGDPHRERCWRLGVGVAAGLGFSTKGPVTLLPCLAMLAFPGGGFWLGPGSLAAFLVLGLSWYVWACASHPGLIRYLLVEETIQRFTSNRYHNAAFLRGPVIYGASLLAGSLPWLTWWPAALRGFPASWRTWTWFRGARERAEPAAFLLLWLLLPLSILLLSHSKLGSYMAPLYPPLVLAMARGLVREGDPERLGRIRRHAVLGGLVLASLKVAAGYVPIRRNLEQQAAAIDAAGGPGSRVFAVTAPLLPGHRFYLGDRLEGLSPSAASANGRRLLPEVVRELADHPGDGTCVFLSEDPGQLTALDGLAGFARRVEGKIGRLTCVVLVRTAGGGTGPAPGPTPAAVRTDRAPLPGRGTEDEQ